MHGVRLHKTSRRDAMARDPRRDLLGRDQDILLRDRDASVRDETWYVSRLRRLDRDHIPAKLRWLRRATAVAAVARNKTFTVEWTG